MSEVSDGKTKYGVPDPTKFIPSNSEKYSLGLKGSSFNKIKNLKPTFAFDYISLKKSELCFNSTLIKTKNYHSFFDKLKRISNLTYDDLSKDVSFKFHSVDFAKINIGDYKKCLTNNTSSITDENLPTLYQFKLFEEARACGFLYKGVFYLVWFDRNHEIYPR